MDISDGIDQIVGLIDDNDVVFNGKIKCLSSRLLEKQGIWKGYDL